MGTESYNDLLRAVADSMADVLEASQDAVTQQDLSVAYVNAARLERMLQLAEQVLIQAGMPHRHTALRQRQDLVFPQLEMRRRAAQRNAGCALQ